MRSSTILLMLLAVPVAYAQPAKPETHTIKIDEHTFTLPKGFTIEKVAGSPQIERPVNGSFDEQGRLYVTDSSGSNDRPTEQVKNPTHRVVRLESTKRDGNFDKATVFADKLSFLQGSLWYRGSLYVAAPPVILKLTDTDRDGVADRREVWFDGKSLGGCANDVHGPYLGPDGKIYWTKGGFGAQEHILKGGKKFKTRHAHIYRSEPDGNDLEVVMTGGMDNPVGVTWAKGELFFSTTFFQHPEAGRRDGLIHNTYGALYGKHHDELEEYLRPGPKLSEPMTHLGPAAPSGLVAYRHAAFGEDYADNLFCAQFNMAKVSRHVLKPKGSTFETSDSDFVTSDNRDFHPTDVVVDADGSLLILDTGGWYKLCCPSSQLTKKDVLGAIYRVRRIDPFKGVAKGELQLPQRRESLHLAEKLGREAKPNDGSSRIVLRALADIENDSVLDTAYTRALIDIADVKTVREALKDPSPRVVRAALASLEQIPDAKLAFAEVQPHFNSSDPNLRETAWWIAGRHPAWGKELATDFAKSMENVPAQERPAFVERVARFAGNSEVQAMLAENVHHLVAVEVMARSKLKAVPDSWPAAITRAMLKPGTAEWNSAALTAYRSFPAATKRPTGWDTPILALARDAKRSATERLLALTVAKPTALDEEWLTFALPYLDSTNPTATRALAAEVLVNAKLTPAQSQRVIALLPKASILDLEKLLQAFAKNPDEAVGLALLKSLDTPAFRAAIRSEQLKPIFAGYSQAVRTEAAKFAVKLDEALKTQRAGLDKLLDGAEPGDIRRGQLVFNSTKTNCAACHKIGYVGGTIGPDLTRIGGIRSEADLLESIVVPSASFVRSYESVQVIRFDGRMHSGILKRDSPDEVVLTISATEEIRVPRADIELLKPGTVSVMPAGLEKQISKQELADLLAFLKGLK